MSMNLHAIAAPIVGIVNGPQVGTHYVSDGYDTSVSGKRTPKWLVVSDVSMQVQALTGGELQLVESLNIQGIKRAVHLFGDVKGVDRASKEGGDVLYFLNEYWLVTVVLETWDSSGWCRVAVTKQNGAPAGITP